MDIKNKFSKNKLTINKAEKWENTSDLNTR